MQVFGTEQNFFKDQQRLHGETSACLNESKSWTRNSGFMSDTEKPLMRKKHTQWVLLSIQRQLSTPDKRATVNGFDVPCLNRD